MLNAENADSEAYSFVDEESRNAAEKAMSLLLFKDRTRKELSERLYRIGFSEQAVDAAMEYVGQFGYINDRRYVENYIMFQKGKRSRKEIAYKLSQKGIPRELFQEVLEETEYEGEEDAVRVQLEKKLKGKKICDLSYEEKSKLIASLGRKGYERSSIKNVFSQLDN